MYTEYVMLRGRFFPQMITCKIAGRVALIVLILLTDGLFAISQCGAHGHVNGCSVPGDLPYFYKDHFKPACNKHDICYGCVSQRISMLSTILLVTINLQMSRRMRKYVGFFLHKEQIRRVVCFRYMDSASRWCAITDMIRCCNAVDVMINVQLSNSVVCDR